MEAKIAGKYFYTEIYFLSCGFIFQQERKEMSLVADYLEDYIKNLQPICAGELGEIQKRAYDKNVPIIPNDVVKLIGFVLSIAKPRSILEIGTAIGFSSSYMSTFLQEGGHITTIDRFPVMYEQAKENYKKLNLEDKITLLEGDAKDILPTLEGEFDVVFADAAKGQYIHFLPDIYRLTKVGGIIIADDILQDGRVARNLREIERRQRTMHGRLNDFLWEITHNPALRTSILTVGDGVALCHKIKNTEGLIVNEREEN